MSTKIRPIVSESNASYISKERRYELVHFCKQYDEWKNEIKKETELARPGEFDPTGNKAVKLARLNGYICLVEEAAKQTSKDLFKYILEGVTHNKTYEEVRACMGIPCCRNEYYLLYRRFFYILSEMRD